ncbi:hypothetical protein FRB94_005023 [Tulasnella sp. JGI-2019a]|nr:hypothetical protein FRB94_005023 [Tulasnella sp. JGI-2019a]KAG9008186.1 hypothetical protein FRB93_006754 [Tulasnella sp. JGI-2019a]KAG9023994.1 hypothetical protein FRB95_012227 [Tulasnella sp. JGI-2019a]
MSDFTGPGVYMVIPTHARDMCVDAWGRKHVKIYDNARCQENQIWEIVAAGGDFGDPEVGDKQYHFLAVDSALVLCAPDNAAKGICSLGSRSVRHPSTRWKIVSAGGGAFYIVSAAGANLALNVTGGGRNRGDDLVVTTRAADSHFQFELKKPDF